MEKLNEAVYLINDERYLHLRENSAGVGFATYNRILPPVFVTAMQLKNFVM